MLITLICSIMLMAGLFLILWGGVGFIQDKRFFSSAPREVQEVTPDHVPERLRRKDKAPWVYADEFWFHSCPHCLLSVSFFFPSGNQFLPKIL